MRCTSCGHDVADHARFCTACGSKLERICEGCGGTNDSSAKFCGQCGTALDGELISEATEGLAAPVDAVSLTRDQEAALEGARKTVTVLFADVAGFTTMSERIDAEDAADIMRPCFDLMQETVHRYGGTVSQFLGDGIMALFGAPLAHEDHAERGTLAALSIQRAVRVFGEELAARSGIDLRMRVGLNSGSVVVETIGTDLNPTYTAIGDAVNLASRIEGLAPVGSVAMSEDTAQLVAGLFETRDMGRHSVKGKDVPVQVFEVLRPLGHSAPGRHDSRLIGREQQLSTMLARFDEVKAGHGQLMVLSGAPGIGKSRLTEEFIVGCAGQPTIMIGHCVSYGAITPYLPIIDLLRRLIGLEEADGEDTVIRKLDWYAASLPGHLEDALSWIRFLLAVDPGDGAVTRVDATIRKLRVFEALRSFLLAHAIDDPVVLIVEDVHWIDEVSQEFISFLLESIETERVAMVLTHRPEYDLPVGAAFRDRTALTLSQLASQQSEALATELLAANDLPPDLSQAVSARAGGNPFFVEEVVRSLQQTATNGDAAGDLGATSMPATVEGVIAARLDRLDQSSLSVIRAAAFIGTEFSADVLASACAAGTPIAESVATLKRAELVVERSLFSELTYAFRHGLVRDVVIQSLLRPQRRSLHLAVAHALETTRLDRQREFVEALAHHFSEAQAWPEAAKYLLQSGRKALAAATPVQAESFFRQALDVVETAPDALEPKELIATHRGHGRAIKAAGEFDRSIKSFTAMLRVAEAEGDQRGQTQALLDLVDTCMWAHRFEEANEWAEIVHQAAIDTESDLMLAGTRFYVAFMSGLTGDLAVGRQAAAEALEVSERPGGAPLRVGASMMQGGFDHWDGRASQALEHFGRMVELCRQPAGMETLSHALVMEGMAACAGGDYRTAFASLEESLDLATRLNDRPRLSRVLNTMGWVHHDLCDFDTAITLNAESVEIADELGDPEIISFGNLNLVDCYLEVGQLDQAQAHLEPVIQESRRDAALGDQWMRWRYSMHLDVNSGWLALRDGELATALNRAKACVDAARAASSIRYVGRGLRLRGMALAGLGHTEAAAEALGESLQATREVGNPYQTWRTLASLAELLLVSGRPDDALVRAREALTVVDGVAESLSGTRHAAPLLSSIAVTTLRSWSSAGRSAALDPGTRLGLFP